MCVWGGGKGHHTENKVELDTFMYIYIYIYMYMYMTYMYMYAIWFHMRNTCIYMCMYM